jgi:putative ABC transport system permease protein
MTIFQSLAVSLRALRGHPLRSLLTMLGIIIGVAAVITMVAVGRGAQVRIEEQIRTLGANLLMVEPGAGREGGARLAAGTRHTLTEADAAAIASETPGVVTAAPAIRGTAQIVRGNRNWRTTINGTWPDYFLAREWPVAAGRAFSLNEVNRAAKVALIGVTVAEALFGKEDPVGGTIRIADVPFEVVGVLERKGPSGTGHDQDDVVFVPLNTARIRLLGGGHEMNREAVHYVLVKAAQDGRTMDRVENNIRMLLRDRHRLADGRDDDFRVWNPAAAMAAQNKATETFSILLAAVASISLIVGGISIMNIMLVSVTERTREIGLRLAVGASRRDIRRQFLTEAVTLCVFGGVLGVVLGVGAAAAVSGIAGWAVFIGPDAVLGAVLFSAIVGIFFGIYPAVRASRLDPIEALRFE